MSLHDQKHAMTNVDNHSATNWSIFYSDGSGHVNELANGAAGKCLVSGGTAAAPAWSSLISEVLITCDGATPLTTDFTTQAEGSHGFAVGTGGRVWKWYKNAVGVYASELTSVPAE